MHIMKNVPVVMRMAIMYTAIFRKSFGESPCDNPERYCGRFWVHCSSKKFERMALEATDICLQVRSESNKSTATVIRNNVLIISHIIFRDCHVHIFSDKLLALCFQKFWLSLPFFGLGNAFRYSPSPKSVRYSTSAHWGSSSALFNSTSLWQASLAVILELTSNPVALSSSLYTFTGTS